MMRRGPLADYPIETLLADAASERISGVLTLRSAVGGSVFLVDGDVYLAEIDGQPPLDERLVSAGLLTTDQVAEHGVPSPEGVYLARALDTDVTIDEDAIDAYLKDVSAATISRFVGVDDGEFELDPYGSHPAGVLSSWAPGDLLEHAQELLAEAARREAERLEAERAEAERAEAERVEAERVAAEQAALERAEAERAEAERLEAARAEAERREAERAQAEAQAAEQDAVVVPEAEDNPSDPETLPPPPEPTGGAIALGAVPEEDPVDLGPSVLVVVSEEPPDGVESIALTAQEWRVVIRAAQGDSLATIARRLGLPEDETRTIIDGLSARSLLATMEPGRQH